MTTKVLRILALTYDKEEIERLHQIHTLCHNNTKCVLLFFAQKRDNTTTTSLTAL